MYADRITKSMKTAIDETERRRKIQKEYNTIHNIEPKTIVKSVRDVIEATKVAEDEVKYGKESINKNISPDELDKLIKNLETEMLEAAQNLQFERAAELRDKIESLKEQQG